MQASFSGNTHLHSQDLARVAEKYHYFTRKVGKNSRPQLNFFIIGGLLFDN